MHKENIRIGTLVNWGQNSPSYIRQIMHHGFETYSLTFWQQVGDTDLARLAGEVKDVLAGTDAVISSICVYGNALMDRDIDRQTRESWERLIDAAHLFGCDVVGGWTGRLIDTPVDECIPRYVEVFEPLAKRAADNGLRIAFENCEMGGDWKRGDWNIAHTPAAWELMFDALPVDNIGLQWEPCHQMVKLIDPLPQLRKYVSRIFSLHGKDATILWDVIREHGIHGSHQFAYHRTPGFGDSNWADIISILRMGGYSGAIEIEGWHDPVYRDELEMTGQVRALNYLKECRGGAWMPNPS